VLFFVKALDKISAFMPPSEALKYKSLQVQRIERDHKGLYLYSDFYADSLIPWIFIHAASITGFLMFFL